MRAEPYFVYVLASRIGGTLYIGATSDLRRRVWEHKNKVVPGFTAKYSVTRLVWFEAHDGMAAALQRERQLKEWKRAWKIRMIEESNPNWDDLFPGLRF